MVIINNKPENLGYIGIISFTNVLYKLGIPERAGDHLPRGQRDAAMAMENHHSEPR